MTAPGDARDDARDEDLDEIHLGEVPEGLGPDLHARNLESLSREPAFSDGVLSLTDTDGVQREVALDDVHSAESFRTDGADDEAGRSRTKIVLRSGVIVVATGAVVAGAITAVRYRRKQRS